MKPIFFALFIALCLQACKNRSNTEPFTTNMLPTQEFVIDVNKDTVLKTLHGSKITIKANSFNTREKVTVTIKEALTAFEIFAAGLTTESNGRPLRSGGMIFIDALAGGKQPELLQPINISVPASSWDSEMRLFKGEETADGNINWVNPDSLNETPRNRQLLLGKTIFQSKCTPCHSIFSNSTGPALMGVDERIPDRAKIHQWISDNAVAIASGDPLFVNISRFSTTTMDLFPALTRYDTDAIIEYINNEVALNKNNLPVATAPAIIDTITGNTDTSKTGAPVIPASPCIIYDTIVPIQKNEISFVATGNYEQPRRTAENVYDTIPENILQDNPEPDTYEFDIDSFGWYNIDAFMNEAGNMITVQLTAEVKGYDEKDIKVILFCPDKKIQLAFKHVNGNLYQSDKNYGDLKLFKNDRAVLFACMKKGDSYYYGISEFRVAEQQQIIISVKKGSFDDMKSMLTTQKIDGIDIQVEKPETKIIAIPCESSSSDSTDTIGAK